MSKFQVTYANGDSAEYASECDTVDGFCNEHFGSAWDAAKAAGAKVVMEGAEPVVEDKKAEKPQSPETKPAKKK